MGQYQGDTLIFSYKRKLRPFFGGSILDFSVFGGFQNKIFLVCLVCGNCFGIIT